MYPVVLVGHGEEAYVINAFNDAGEPIVDWDQFSPDVAGINALDANGNKVAMVRPPEPETLYVIACIGNPSNSTMIVGNHAWDPSVENVTKIMDALVSHLNLKNLIVVYDKDWFPCNLVEWGLNRNITFEPGWHVGSKYHGLDPDLIVVFPTFDENGTAVSQITNTDGIATFDVWTDWCLKQEPMNKPVTPSGPVVWDPDPYEPIKTSSPPPLKSVSPKWTAPPKSDVVKKAEQIVKALDMGTGIRIPDNMDQAGLDILMRMLREG